MQKAQADQWRGDAATGSGNRFEKAFDSIELIVLLQVLGEEENDGNCVEVNKEVKSECSINVTLLINLAPVPIEDCKAGHPLSPKLYGL